LESVLAILPGKPAPRQFFRATSLPKRSDFAISSWSGWIKLFFSDRVKSRIGGVAMSTTTTCRACGTQPFEDARFCHSCGSPIAAVSAPAEYKQVTVLFADVVHSMDIAASVGAERLREIMAELFDRCAAVVRRYGGTVDKFTGDGIMAVFGAPVALEDHAFRACLAALEIQRSDGGALQLRVGLNSGEVVAGEIGSGPGSYTAIGEQVGMAQRMESVAPPGGVMLS
jgi:class 3 adenylate cyclase